MIDSQLINECKSGGRAAFKQVYESCAPYVYTIIKRYSDKSDYHKDLMQETFAKVFLNIKQYDSEKGEFKFWIRRIAINECFKHHNSQKKIQKLNVAYKQEPSTVSYDESYDYLKKEEVEALLVKMPKGYKQVFMLVVIDGYSHKEVADLLNINAVTSRSQLLRAKNWMKKEIMSDLKSLKDGTF